MEYFYFAGIKIDNLNLKDATEKIREILNSEGKGYVVTPNAAHIVELQKDKEFKKAYEKAILSLPDSIPIIWISKLFGNPLNGRCAGADLFEKVFYIAEDLNKRVFILGGPLGSEKIVQEKIIESFPNVKVASYSPPFGFENSIEETSKIIDMINSFRTDLLLVCVGAPKSEKWIYNNFHKLDIKIAFALGAALDYFLGNKKRAPKWMQRIGMEWLWRLFHEPKRLWKRYLIGNTIFIWLVFKELLKRFFRQRSR